MADDQPFRDLEAETREFYTNALAILQNAHAAFLVGGAYAFERYTGIVRHTKDFDIFVKLDDWAAILDLFSAAGYRTEQTFPHWLGKIYQGDDCIDVIFASGNGVARVDQSWFDHAVDDDVLGVPVKLCPAEEILWTKMLIMERERYDGADVAHILQAQYDQIDWQRLRERMEPQWRVLLSHLVLFGFIYPAERNHIPDQIMHDLIERLQHEQATEPPPERVCQGTVLSREQYLIDVQERGYRDARVQPLGNMTPDQTAHWTAAIEDDHG